MTVTDDLRKKTHLTINDLFDDTALSFMREAIAHADGNEIFFVGIPGDDNRINTLSIHARGNEQGVPALMNVAQPGHVIIHNHPSGVLRPSGADLNIASILGQNGIGSYIINNEVTDCYVIVLPLQPQELQKIDIDQLSALIEPNSAFAERFEGYEHRPQQIQMLRSVAESLNNDKLLLVEAGTGTGKSMAYLIPLIRWAVTNQERCVISTNTINLQEQLVYKDIPALKKIMPDDFTVSLVKGRQNYICKRKLNMILQSPDTHCDQEELDELYRIAEWAKRSKDGSLSDLNFVPSSELWEKICSDSDSCTRSQCVSFGDCFTTKARRRAAAANVLIVNHHLLFADIAIKKETGFSMDIGILPPYKRIVFDEAHHMEDVATSYFGLNISQRGLLRIVHRLYNKRGKNEKGHWIALTKKLARGALNEKTSSYINRVQTECIPGVAILDDAIRTTFVFLNELLRNILTAEERADKKWRIPAQKQSIPNWQRLVDEQVRSLRTDMKSYFKQMKSFLEELIDYAQLSKINISDEITELSATMNRIDKAVTNLEWILLSAQDEADDVRWIELAPRSQLRIHCAPVTVAEQIYDCVISRFPTLILTSATLTIEDRFDFISSRLGFDRVSDGRVVTSLISSPFDYQKQVFMGIPKDIAEPGSARFNERLTAFLEETLRIMQGGTFVLFTSFQSLNACYRALSATSVVRHVDILRQGDEPRHQLLEKFRNDRRSVLFGTNSFWEGVDVKGAALECVVLTRLPFRVPSDPVVESRVEYIKARGGNPFMEYLVPLAVVKFRQGFGRLIRTKTDRGAVLIMDKRVLTKSYGKRFLRSLPECTVACDESLMVLHQMRAFFEL